ncbi:hypothetical protein SLEP1_g38468 [Rubroshorea leprosula]|nr:hypothetical protein SLEP1_g38468 [Rubroshorea leprosula]
MTKMSNEADQNFMHMAIDCFSRIMPGRCSKKIENHQRIKHMHLLGLLHGSCVSPPKGVNPPPTEATCSPRSASSSTTKPSGIARIASDSHLMNANPNGLESASSAKLKSKWVPLRRAKSFVRYSLPEKSDEEKSLLPLETEAGSGESSKGAIEDNHHLQCSILRKVKPKGHEEKNYDWQTMGSASELHEAGITFKKIEDRLFDITFERGVMSIPTLKIVDDTESILRNLVAYEQCYKDIYTRHFTDYVRFMDCLINTGKDVELLRRHEVIENRLGDNEVIAGIFNRICDAVLIAEDDCFYSEMFNKVNKHCRKRTHRWMANFRHNYVNTPWGLISIIAAVILLLLTVQQSVYSILDYHFPH